MQPTSTASFGDGRVLSLVTARATASPRSRSPARSDLLQGRDGPRVLLTVPPRWARKASVWTGDAITTALDQLRASRLPAESRLLPYATCGSAHAVGLRRSLRPTNAPVGLNRAEISLNEPELPIRPLCKTCLFAGRTGVFRGSSLSPCKRSCSGSSPPFARDAGGQCRRVAVSPRQAALTASVYLGYVGSAVTTI